MAALVTELRQLLLKYKYRLEIDDIEKSDLFDADFYRNNYLDIRDAGVDPLVHFVRQGWREMRDPNRLFSTQWYLEAYPDVSAQKVNPLLHYVRTGALERRDTGPQFRPSQHQDPRTPRGAFHLAAAMKFLRGVARGTSVEPSTDELIVIVAELSIPQCRKYRVDQKAAMLRRLGWECLVYDWRQPGECEAALRRADLAIFYRVPLGENLEGMIATARQEGVPTLWEVDDLIFDPNQYILNANLEMIPRDLQRAVLEGVPAYRGGLLACDGAIASTSTLATAMRQAGVEKVFVLENGLDDQTLADAEFARQSRGNGDGFLRVVYGSGTKTHDTDFLEASAGLLACMRANPDVRLRIIGELTLPDDFEPLSNRVERFPISSYLDYLRLAAQCDVAIAPLEPSVFNDCKSNIKFIEASMLALPSVCSPRSAFTQVVEHDRNGLLADGPQAWREALERLVCDHRLRWRLAAAARQTVMETYDLDRLAERQLAPIVGRPTRYTQPDPGLSTAPRAPRLRVLLANVFFSPRSFGGATIVAEEVAKILSRTDDTTVAVFTSVPVGVAEPYELFFYRVGQLDVHGISLPETHDPALDFDTPYVIAAWREAIRLSRPDVVHLHSIQGLGAALIDVCVEEDIPVVVTLHDAWWICGRQFMVTGAGKYCGQHVIDLNVCSACVENSGLSIYRQYRLRTALLKADLILTPSAFSHRLHYDNGFSGKDLRLNGNGIRRPRADYAKDTQGGPLRFGYVGGNSEIKGVHILERALNAVRGSEYELVIVDNMLNLGFASFEESTLRNRDNVIFKPAYTQDTMDEFFGGIDVLLFPTQCKESFGLTVREALIRDIWVITTDAGGVVEDIVNGENGTIIPLEDDGTALAAAIDAALRRKVELKAHVNPYKDRIVTYERQAAELKGYLREVVDGRFAAAPTGAAVRA